MNLMTDILRGRSGRSAPLLALWVVASATACGGLLDVDNPNNIKAEDIENPVAAASLANGAQASVAAALPSMALLTGTASDEFDWSGSRDGWNELDHGNVHNPFNEFTDGAFPQIAEGRWLADEAVRVLEIHLANNKLTNKSDLARAYLTRAIIYSSIAEQFEDWALSNKDSAAAPVGKANMGTFFDVAVSSTDAGLGITGISSTLRLQLTAVKARAQFAKSIWTQIRTSPIPLGAVANSAAATTALAAIGMLTTTDWKFQYQYGANTVGTDYRGWVNQRQEMRIGKAYAAPDPSGKPTWTTTVLNDPITGTTDPVIDREQKAFKAASYPPFTITSAREMRLIVAEDALARSDIPTFQTQINAIRGIDALPNWTPASTVSALDMLKHERRVSLFLQARRMLDHYRFGPSTYPADWFSNATAVVAPGTLLPISAVECLSNPFIGAANCGK